jgi:hypothetical protein
MSPEAPKDVLLAPIIAVAERLSKLVLTDDDGDKEKEGIPKEEIPKEEIPSKDILRRRPNRRARSQRQRPEERKGAPKGHRASLRATRNMCRPG